MRGLIAFLVGGLLLAGCHDWDGALERCVDGGQCYDPTVPLTFDPPLGDAYLGDLAPAALAARGGRPPYRFSVSSGSLPTGLQLEETGSFSGSFLEQGIFDFALRVTDANDLPLSRPLRMEVLAAPAIASATLEDAYTDQPWTATFTASGGRAPLTFSTASLPPGLSLSADGVLAGTLTTVGAIPLQLGVTDANGRSATRAFTLQGYSPPSLAGGTLPPAYATETYSHPLLAVGGKPPLTLSVVEGTLPDGLSLTPGGLLAGTVGASVVQAAQVPLEIRIVDANLRTVDVPLQLPTFHPPLLGASLPTAYEGVSYLSAPGVPVQVPVTLGASPYTFSATGLPAGLSLSQAGDLTGIPAQGTAGSPSPSVTVTDAHGRSATAAVGLVVLPPARSVGGTGTLGLPPTGSPITSALTVYVVDNRGVGRAGIGVRLRKNGVEYSPIKQGLTDATGKLFFGGLDLNGTTDTVDLTVNGPGIANTTLARLNAAVVSVMPRSLPIPLPRYGGGVSWDPTGLRLIVSHGTDYGRNLMGADANDLVTYSVTSNTWTEVLLQGMDGSPSPRHYTGLVKAKGSTHVMFGGEELIDGTALNDTWEFNAGTNSWAEVRPTRSPSPRAGAAMVADSSGSVWLFGGQSYFGDALTDLWRYDSDANTWTEIVPTNSGPSRTVLTSAAFQPSEGLLWICGGAFSHFGDSPTAECWRYSPISNAWSAGPALPSGRMGGAMSAASNGSLYLFGGQAAGKLPLADLISLPSGGGSWAAAGSGTAPSARIAAGMVDSFNGLLLFGGTTQLNNNRGDPFSDLWRFNVGTQQWLRLSGPAPVQGFSLSGTFSGAYPTGISSGTVYVSSDAGFATSVRVSLTAGAGSYRIDGLPPGVTLKVHAINSVATTVAPGGMYSFVELGTVGPLSSNEVLNVAFPGQVTSLVASATVIPPAHWTQGSANLSGSVGLDRPGFSRTTIGSAPQTTNASMQFNFFPVAPGIRTASVVGYSLEPNGCQYHYAYTPPFSTGNIGVLTLPDPVLGQVPGRVSCDPSGEGFAYGPWLGLDSTATHFAVGDLNQDGLDDAVATQPVTDTVAIYLSTATGFSRVADVPTEDDPRVVALANVVGDSHLDLVVAQQGTGRISVRQGLGTGAFAPPTFVAASLDQPVDLQALDVDASGGPDLLVLNAGTGPGLGSLTLLEHNGGGWTARPSISLPVAGPYSLTAGQVLAAPGEEAVVTAEVGQRALLVRFALAPASRLELTVLDSSEAFTSAALTELNADTFPEVVLTHAGPSGLMVIPGLSATQLEPTLRTAVPLECVAREVLAVELEPGLPDALVAVCEDRLVTLKSQGGQPFRPVEQRSEFLLGLRIAVGDVDGNGQPDLVASPSFGDLEVRLGEKTWIAGSDASYSFQAPPGASLVTSYRFGAGGALEWEYVSPLGAGPFSFSYPAVSTLAPARPWPTGRRVSWDQNIRLENPDWTFNHARLNVAPGVGQVSTDFFHYRR